APEYVLASYTSKRAEVSLDDLGYRQLVSLYRALASCPGVAAPVVVDASDLSAAPGVVLKALCARIGIGYTDDMLTWAPGPRPEDGIWARHWYAAVRRSNGLEPKPRAALPELEPKLADIARAARPLYEELAAARLIVAPG
ncbi:MAG: HAD family hydrolase, partial [Pseudomonadota bacterium]